MSPSPLYTYFFAGCLAVVEATAGTEQEELSRVYHEIMDNYNKYTRPINSERKSEAMVEEYEPETLDVQFGVSALCFDLTPDGILQGHLKCVQKQEPQVPLSPEQVLLHASGLLPCGMTIG